MRLKPLLRFGVVSKLMENDYNQILSLDMFNPSLSITMGLELVYFLEQILTSALVVSLKANKLCVCVCVCICEKREREIVYKQGIYFFISFFVSITLLLTAQSSRCLRKRHKIQNRKYTALLALALKIS